MQQAQAGEYKPMFNTMEKPIRKDFTTDGEFQEAMKAHKLLNAPKTETKLLTKFEIPKVIELEGALTQMSDKPLKGANGQFRTGTMASGDRFVVSETIFADNKKMLSLGNVISVKVEARLAGKTGYIDAKGVEQCHTKDGYGYVSASYDPEFLKTVAKADLEVATRQSEIDGAVESVSRAIASASDKDKAIIGESVKINVNFSR